MPQPQSSTITTLSSARVDYAENSSILVAHVDSTYGRQLSLNKNWRDRETGEWRPGKGFWIPEEFAVEFILRCIEVLGLDIEQIS